MKVSNVILKYQHQNVTSEVCGRSFYDIVSNFCHVNGLYYIGKLVCILGLDFVFKSDSQFLYQSMYEL